MQRTDQIVVVLGTGGTIAGTSAAPGDNIGYTAAQLGVAQLVKAVPALAAVPLEPEQVAQVDSKDMSAGVWRALVGRLAHHLARPDVAGVVVTHGTDTLEETAWLLQRVLAPAKPVVLTAAMRPATSLQPDGPQNLLDAVTVAQHPGARGVVAVLGGVVHGAADVRKVHTYRIEAFDSGDAGPVGRIEEGRLRLFRPWPVGEALPAALVGQLVDGADWPRVDILLSHAGVDGVLVDALVERGTRGIVVAGTGHGTVHHALEAALLRAQAAGVRVLRCSRVAGGPVFAQPGDVLPAGGEWSPYQARIELLLQLLAQ
jgi:L-asparaginase